MDLCNIEGKEYYLVMSKKWGLLRVEKICNAEGKVYLKRYRLVDTPWFHIFLHRIYLSDSDRDYHDHPWPFTSIMLWNRYFEHMPGPDGNDVVREYKAGDIIHHGPEELHYLEIVPGETCTTLVFTGKRVRTWGFQTLTEWIPYFNYKDVGRRC